ncbi:MAG: hypothetical protein RLY93_18635 [Sumerlaeia bacterium]
MTPSPAEPSQLTRSFTHLSPAACVAIAVILGWLAFGLSLRNGFVYDDHDFVVRNTYVHEIDGLWPLLTERRAQNAGVHQHPIWRPLRNLSFWMDYRIAGLGAWWYHLHNLLWHGMAIGGVFALGRRIGLRPTAAFIAALLFAIHPVQSESVVWVKERDGLMSVAMTLWAVFFALGERWKSAASAFVLAVAAMLSKEWAVMAGPLMVAGWICQARMAGTAPPSFKRMVILGSAVGTATLLFLLARDAVIGTTAQLETSLGGSFLATQWTMFEVYARYAGFVLWPFRLPLFFTHIQPSPPADPLSILGLLLVLTLVGAAVFALVKKRTVAAFALFWILVAFFPYTNIVPMMQWMAVRFLYGPMAGVALLTGVAFQLATAHPKRNWLFAGIGLAAALWIVLSIQRTLVWNDDFALWREEYRINPEPRDARVNYANALLRQGKPQQALTILEDYPYFDLHPYNPRVDSRAVSVRAQALIAMGRQDQAHAFVLEALQGPHEGSFTVLMVYGELALAQGNHAEAEALYRSILAALPGLPEAQAGLNRALAGQTAAPRAKAP